MDRRDRERERSLKLGGKEGVMDFGDGGWVMHAYQTLQHESVRSYLAQQGVIDRSI